MSNTVSSSVNLATWSWTDWKWFVELSTDSSSEAFHVIIAVILFLAAALVLRRRVSSWLPWPVVVVLAILNEAVELLWMSGPSVACNMARACCRARC